MNKIRYGMFETNSSSTHTCIIGAEEDMDKWMNKEYLYAPSFIKKMKNVIKPEFIHNEFINRESLSSITLLDFKKMEVDYEDSSIPKTDSLIEVPSDKTLSSFTLKDIWDLLLEFRNNIEEYNCNDEALKDTTSLEYCIAYLFLNWIWIDEWTFNSFFQDDLGIYDYEEYIENNEELEFDTNYAEIKGVPVTVFCGFGHD